VSGGEGAARLAGSSSGPALPCVGIVVVFLLLLLILVLIVRGLEEGAAGLGEGDSGLVVAGLQWERLGAVTVAGAGALVVGWGRRELGGVVRGSVVVLDNGGGGIHHSSSHGGGRGGGGAGRRVCVRVDGGAE